MYRICLLTCVMLAAISGDAFGGGGGKKSNSTLKVLNGVLPNTGDGDTFYVVIDPPSTIDITDVSESDISTLQSLGTAVNPGASATFKVKAGAHVALFVDLTNGTTSGTTITYQILDFTAVGNSTTIVSPDPIDQTTII